MMSMKCWKNSLSLAGHEKFGLDITTLTSTAVSGCFTFGNRLENIFCVFKLLCSKIYWHDPDTSQRSTLTNMLIR